jgi:hypothetical protein
MNILGRPPHVAQYFCDDDSTQHQRDACMRTLLKSIVESPEATKPHLSRRLLDTYIPRLGL